MSYMANPVQRLHRIVSGLIAVPDQRTTTQGHNVGNDIRYALQTALGLSDDVSRLRAVADILTLPDDAAEALKASLGEGPRLTAHLQWLPSVSSAVQCLPNFTDSISSFRQHIPAGTVETLYLSILEVADPTDVEPHGDPDAERVEEVVAELEELAQMITNASIHAGLKRFLLLHIDRMRTALSEYRIIGAEGVLQQSDAALGAVWRASREHAEWFDEGESTRSTMEKFFIVLGRVADTAGVAAGVVMLAPWVQQMLPG